MNSERYSRQILFAPFGEEGQRKLGESSVVLVGCGALGSCIANTLVRSGVGTLTIIDPDRLELSNLQRQSLFDEAAVAARRFKAEAACERLRQINRTVEVRTVTERLERHNIVRLIGRPNVILDGCDDFPTRYLLNDYSVRENIPWILGACAAAYGLAMPILPGRTPCLRCIFPAPPEQTLTSQQVGIVAPIVHAVAALQTIEAIKILSGNAAQIAPVLFNVDLWESHLHTLRSIERDPGCRCCAERRFEFLEVPS
jgi:molybdopterin/thiamine biosynthesis adenylyltransferase